MKPSITNLFTLESSNKGVKLPIPLPNGKPSGCSFTVLGADSDVFRRAKAERMRQGPEILALPPSQQPDAIREADIVLLASVIIGWDFPEPFSSQTAINTLRQAPHVFDFINGEIADRGNFFDEKSIACSDMPSASSD